MPHLCGVGEFTRPESTRHVGSRRTIEIATMKRRLLLSTAFLIGVLAFGPLADTARACPMCKEANESQEDDSRPRAYMYSILFMLAMPATLAAGFGIGLYRLSKRRDSLVSSLGSEDSGELESK